MLNDPVVAASAGGIDSGGAGDSPDTADVNAQDRMPPGPAVRQLGARALPWLLAVATASVALLQVDTPVLDIARYGAYVCLGVTLPGLLVARATLGTRGNWPEDVAIGAVTGLALELVAFALWSVVGQQQRLWLWPVLVIAVFAAVPRLRPHWKIGVAAIRRPLPVLWSWGVASAIAVSTAIVRETAFRNPMPPAGGVYDQDVPWHLSIVHELTRSFPPQVPQVSAETLRYHWLSHAHLAAGHLVSGAPEATVVLRLSILPLLAVTALVGANLAVELSGRWWSGPIAAWALVVLEGTNVLPVLGEAGSVFPTSPSQIYVLPLVLGASTLVVRGLRGLRLGAGWVVLALILMAAAGAKPTAMPLILAGACLAGLSLLTQRRRQWRSAGWVMAIVVVILPVSLLYVQGSDGGSSRLSLFDFVEWIPFYHRLTGAAPHPSDGPFLPEGVSDLSGRSLLILGLLLLVPLVVNVGRLVPFVLLASRRRLGRDPAAWYMAGFTAAGWGVYLTLAHPAYSQAYFLRVANPMASVFGAWALASAVPRTVQTRRRAVAVLAGGTLVGVGVVAASRVIPLGAPASRELAPVVVAFAVPLVAGCVAVVMAVAGWRALRRRAPSLAGWGAGVALAALVVGGPAYGALGVALPAMADFATNKPVVTLVAGKHVPQGVGYEIGADEAAAVAWVEQHTPRDAVVATNRHCAAGLERPGCPSLAFWVSGLGGRRTVLEGWGYTSAAERADGPTPYPQRLAVNDAAFTHPSARTIDRLRRGYGATWLVADRSAAPVSAEIVQFAVPRYSSGPVTVYELR